VKPLIGITLDHHSRNTEDGTLVYEQYLLPHPYTQAVDHAGGVPVLIPYHSPSHIDRYVVMCDGFVLCGGNDYDPARWGQTRHPNAIAIDPARAAFDFRFIAAVEASGKPVLGICGGMQLMNLHRGGTLHQFIPDFSDAIEHRRNGHAEWARRHDVQVQPGSTLARITGSTTVTANTSHKQCVDRLGAGLTIVGRAGDGVVEALEDATRAFFIGVQWHPERQHTEPNQHALFVALIEAARRGQSR
jgi:putative glutamine amidotransferase